MKNRLIIFSFIRKKSFFLYVLLLVVLYSSLLSLNVLLSNLQENRRDNYFNSSLATIHDSNDIFDNLKKNKMLGDVKKVIYFDNNTLTPEIYEILGEVRVSNKIIVMEDSNLNDDEVDLYLNDYCYEELIKQIHSKDSLSFEINNNRYNFIINEIYSSKYINNINVSSNIFNQLLSYSHEYDYIFKLYTSEDEASKNLSDLKMLTGTSEDEAIIANRINQHIKILIIFNIIIGSVFIIVIFILTKNIVHDLQGNVRMETLLGFNNKEISNNIIIRLTILNIIAIVLSLVTSIEILLFINLFYKINVWLFNYYIVLIILLIVIISLCYATKISIEKND